MINRNDQDKQAPSPVLSLWIRRLNRFNEFVERAYSMPMEAAQKVVDTVLLFINVNPLSCACCLCITITATVSVTSIAIGVGIGLGVGCSQIDYIYANSTSG